MTEPLSPGAQKLTDALEDPTPARRRFVWSIIGFDALPTNTDELLQQIELMRRLMVHPIRDRKTNHAIIRRERRRM